MKDIEIKSYQVLSAKIEKEMTILVVSDFHICGHSADEQLRVFSESIAAVQEKYTPHLVLLAGDYVNHNTGITYLPLFIDKLNGKNHLCSVMGNHDYYMYPLWHVLLFPFVKKIKRKQIDNQKIVKIFTDNNVAVLKDNCLTYTINHNTIHILGVDVLTYIEKRTVPDFGGKKGFKILLSHHPDIINEYPHNDIDLVIAGHTHGGLFPWKNKPLYKATRLGIKRPYGMHIIKGKTLIITKGIGRHYSRYFGLPPDITVIQAQKSRDNCIIKDGRNDNN